MKPGKLITLILLLLAAGSLLEAETFRFRFEKGEKYRYVATVTEKAILNDELLNYSDFLNKIAVEVLDVKDESGVVSSLYQVSNRLYTDQMSYTLQEEYNSLYTLDPRGRHTVDVKYLFPLTRSIPSFPENDVHPGATWTAPGEEIHDFTRLFAIKEPFRIPVTAGYKYIGEKIINNRRVAEIRISYSFLISVQGIKPSPGIWYPLKAAGEIEVTYYWDIERGKPHSFDERFDVLYYTSTGDLLEFIGTQKCEVIDASVLDKMETTRDIKQDLENEKLEGVRVEKSDQGVKIVLENIQFEPDSDRLAQAEKSKLDRIAAILKKYPGRDILVIGHTAGQGTKEYLQNLSVRRAKSVGDYLLALGARTASQMAISGKGASEPLGDNQTEEGRKKNRRVEIIILEN